MNNRSFWRPSKRPYRRRIEPPVAADPAFVSASAVSLSTSAVFASLMLQLEQEGILSAEDLQEIYELVVDFLETDEYDAGSTELARAAIEKQFRPRRKAS
jgi:hypothetical protein